MKFKNFSGHIIYHWILGFGTIGIFAGLLEGVIKWVRMLMGVPDPMRSDILWITAAFYGLLASLLGLGVGAVDILITKVFKLPKDVSKWVTVISLALIVFLGWFNSITLIFKSAQWALAILVIGITYQTILFLNERKLGALRFLSSKIFLWIGLVLLIAVGIYGYRFTSSRIFLSKLPSPRQEAPNVILITLDTLRSDHLSAYGYSRETSPNLERFASEGIQFENAFATASWTLPSHATIMTGLYTSEHQAESTTGGRLEDKYHTLAEAFSSRGYETAAIVANEFASTKSLGFGQGFNYFNGLFWNIPDSLRWTNLGQSIFWKININPALQAYQPGRKKASDVNAIFLKWLQNRTDRPYFVWLNYFDPHDPYYAPPPFDTLYGKIPATGQTGSFGNLGASDWGGTLSAEELSWQIDHYDAAITYMDAELGKLFEGLKQAGHFDHTIIVITSDHGEAFGEHHVYGHANSLYREEIQVPLMIRYPPDISGGEKVGENVSLRDLAATITDLAGLDLDEPFPGASLFNQPQDAAVAELYQNPYQPATDPVAQGDLSAIYTQEWEAIFMEGETELYASDDLLQEYDLSSDGSRKNVISDLRNEMDYLLSSLDNPEHGN